MELHSAFASDLEKEQRLSLLLDHYYSTHLKYYDFERVSDKKEQFQGIDLYFIHRKTKKRYTVDEKAQLDYINKNLPTFAFEISYLKNKKSCGGWLFDFNKQTDFYALVTTIYEDAEENYTSCNITFVNRKKLISHLEVLGLNQKILINFAKDHSLSHGKASMPQLHPKNQGYLFYSKKNKAEQPLNLVLKLDWLISLGIAKRCSPQC